MPRWTAPSAKSKSAPTVKTIKFSPAPDTTPSPSATNRDRLPVILSGVAVAKRRQCSRRTSSEPVPALPLQGVFPTNLEQHRENAFLFFSWARLRGVLRLRGYCASPSSRCAQDDPVLISRSLS